MTVHCPANSNQGEEPMSFFSTRRLWAGAKFRRIATLLSLFLLINFAIVEKANAMFDMFKLCMFSEIRGVVLDHGQPVRGARLVRTYDWRWQNEKGSDETTTDDKGEFRFPVVYRTAVFAAILPHEPFVFQQISIAHEGKEYRAWTTDRRDYEPNSETGGKPPFIRCSLESEVAHRGGIYGICEPN
jgi:hypothetical protein